MYVLFCTLSYKTTGILEHESEQIISEVLLGQGKCRGHSTNNFQSLTHTEHNTEKVKMLGWSSTEEDSKDPLSLKPQTSL